MALGIVYKQRDFSAYELLRSVDCEYREYLASPF